MNKKKIAIIGASIGQKILYAKAKEMGLRVIGFAWDKGVLDENMYDEFYEISVKDIDAIVNKCREIGVDGVVTNASEFLIPYASEIAEKLNLSCTPASTILDIQNKENVRYLTNDIDGLSTPNFYIYPHATFKEYPCIVKPIKGAAKKGVSFCNNREEFDDAIAYAGGGVNKILVEEYIPGREFSVESLTYNGHTDIVQVTDKVNSGPPHFVELAHHQPSSIPEKDMTRIEACVKKILKKVGFINGATHIEMKLNEKTGQLFLIEINCRGGGDHISDTLVNLSTDCDYIKEIINISLSQYRRRTYKNTAYSGICYLCAQNRGLIKYFDGEEQPWIVAKERLTDNLSESTTNYDRDGYIIYASDNMPSI